MASVKRNNYWPTKLRNMEELSKCSSVPLSVTALVQHVEMLVATPQLFCSLVHVSDTLIANKQDVIHDAAASAPALPISVRLFGSVHLCLQVDFQQRIYA